ncbi:hypothetical protein BGZ65_004681 [Modicella reniformis]|uniref:Uncharacterized protein n=1 Tax=Modicella reniformis TaxID=1440133 RepID=A0A9P6LSH5_9FUNG|nr:hypothetical protein BGZ65_004681 [Modicella reniformis]
MPSSRSTLSTFSSKNNITSASSRGLPSKAPMAAMAAIAGNQNGAATCNNNNNNNLPPLSNVHPLQPGYCALEKMIPYGCTIVPHRCGNIDPADDLLTPMGTSVASSSNETFDGDQMDLCLLNDKVSLNNSSSITKTKTRRRPEHGSSLNLERKSRLKRIASVPRMQL